MLDQARQTSRAEQRYCSKTDQNVVLLRKADSTVQCLCTDRCGGGESCRLCRRINGEREKR